MLSDQKEPDQATLPNRNGTCTSKDGVIQNVQTVAGEPAPATQIITVLPVISSDFPVHIQNKNL